MTEPRQRKSAADRKAEIVATAIRLAADIGPDRVTTQHLADEVGVTQPAIFRHFATKADIWLAVGDQIVNEMTAIHSHPADLAVADAHGTLHQLIGHHFVHISRNPAIPAILFSRELQAENPTLRAKFDAALKDRRDAIADLIRRAQETGQHSAQIVADDAAQLLMAALQGLSMRWLLDGRSRDLAEEGGRVIGALIEGFRR
jgi:AcrR family transcriptional regulator